MHIDFTKSFYLMDYRLEEEKVLLFTELLMLKRSFYDE